MQDFIDDIKPAVKACGLAFPPPERMGLEVPKELRLPVSAEEPASPESAVGVAG